MHSNHPLVRRRRPLFGTALAFFLSPAVALASHAVVSPVSLDAAGVIGDGESNYADLTPDGRFVAFASDSTNLVPGDTNGVGDVFVLDRVTGALERVSVGLKGAEADGDSNFLGIGTEIHLSNDGRFVAFKSEASNLVRGDRNGVTDVFVFDRVTRTTERVSVADDGSELPGGGDDPAMSPDGRYVAFVTFELDDNFSADVYLRDRVAGTTVRVSVAHDGSPALGTSDSPAIGLGANGPIVAFTSSAPNLVPGDSDDNRDVFVRDLGGAVPTTERVSVSSDESPPTFPGPFGTGGSSPAISDDGRYVAFSSNAVNFTPTPQTEFFSDVFLRDRVAGTTELVSVDGEGGEADGQSDGPSLSSDGRFVAFSSFANDLVPGQTDGDALFMDAFVRDRQAGVTELVSVTSDHVDVRFGAFDTHAGSGPVSADGLVALVSTQADNLFAGDTNARNDVYATDRRPAADLALAMTDEPDPAAPKGTVTYTLTASNLGPHSADGVRIVDVLPAELTFVSASPGCTQADRRVECELGTLAAGGGATVTIVVAAKGRGTFTNTAVVGGAAPDADRGNNTASESTTVAR